MSNWQSGGPHPTGGSGPHPLSWLGHHQGPANGVGDHQLPLGLVTVRVLSPIKRAWGPHTSAQQLQGPCPLPGVPVTCSQLCPVTTKAPPPAEHDPRPHHPSWPVSSRGRPPHRGEGPAPKSRNLQCYAPYQGSQRPHPSQFTYREGSALHRVRVHQGPAPCLDLVATRAPTPRSTRWPQAPCPHRWCQGLSTQPLV